jgi:uncharacterized protein (TIGR00369 family)
LDAVRRWIEESGYARSLGAVSDGVSPEKARIRLPYKECNANPGKALHGGCAASLGLLGGQAITRANLGEEAGEIHTCSLQVNYLAAAIGEDVVADATLLRRGKTMCFVEVDVHTLDGKSIAHVTSMLRARVSADPVERYAPAGDDGAADPGPMGPHMVKLNFAAERGLHVEHMADSRARITMPCIESNLDATGGVHEGAVLALFDTTGAMAAWAETGPGPFKASTPSIQAQLLAPPTAQPYIAYSGVTQRDHETFWADVEVAGQDDGQVIAKGTVIYRIVT